jgi:hypothetical protein
MPRKSQSGQKDKRRPEQQQGNLGQNEAQQQQKKEAELRQMGETVRESDPDRTNKQQSD